MREKIEDLTLSEFGRCWKRKMPVAKPAVAVGKEILYGSGKEYFWIASPGYRVLLDLFQGGSIGDLRPYAGHFSAFTGPDSPMREINTYPYLIQSQIRTGVKTHSADGSRTTLKLFHGAEEKDLCFYPTRIEAAERSGNRTTARLAPVTVKFGDGFSVTLQTIYRFLEDGIIEVCRRILERNGSGGLDLQEYFKGCYGFTEYPEDMHEIMLAIGEKKVHYNYRGRALRSEEQQACVCELPPVNTRVILKAPDGGAQLAELEKGHLFSPFYAMKLTYRMEEGRKETVSWIQISALR